MRIFSGRHAVSRFLKVVAMVATRYIYLNLWDPSGTNAPPAIRELLWFGE